MYVGLVCTVPSFNIRVLEAAEWRRLNYESLSWNDPQRPLLTFGGIWLAIQIGDIMVKLWYVLQLTAETRTSVAEHWPVSAERSLPEHEHWSLNIEIYLNTLVNKDPEDWGRPPRDWINDITD